jgi:hypothetical protein
MADYYLCFGASIDKTIMMGGTVSESLLLCDHEGKVYDFNSKLSPLEGVVLIKLPPQMFKSHMYPPLDSWKVDASKEYAGGPYKRGDGVGLQHASNFIQERFMLHHVRLIGEAQLDAICTEMEKDKARYSSQCDELKAKYGPSIAELQQQLADAQSKLALVNAERNRELTTIPARRSLQDILKGL